MAISIKIEGIPRAMAFITRKKLGVDTGITEGMIKGGNELKDEVKESIAGNKAEPRSVDTGKFKRSIKVGTSATSAVVFSDVEHAKYMEYGTIHIPERRHFRNSMERNRQKIVDITKNIIKLNLITI